MVRLPDWGTRSRCNGSEVAEEKKLKKRKKMSHFGGTRPLKNWRKGASGRRKRKCARRSQYQFRERKQSEVFQNRDAHRTEGKTHTKKTRDDRKDQFADENIKGEGGSKLG